MSVRRRPGCAECAERRRKAELEEEDDDYGWLAWGMLAGAWVLLIALMTRVKEIGKQVDDLVGDEADGAAAD